MALSAKKQEISSREKRIFLRICAWAGIVGPILFVLVFTLNGFLQPDYSALSQMVSWLSLRPAGWIQNGNFIVFGLLLILFTGGFFQNMRSVIKGKWLNISVFLLFISAAGWVNDGFFISDVPNASKPTTHGLMHDIGFLVIFSFLIISFFIVGRQLLKVSAWRTYGWYSIVTSIVALGLLFLLFPIMSRAPQMTGLFNRLLIIEAIAWYVVMGWRFLVLERAQKLR
jgi:hypothetical protein